MKDTFTTTPDAAARYDRASAWEQDEREHDDGPSNYQPDHQPQDCTDATCRGLLCVLARTVAEQKEEARVWAEYKASQRDEEAS